MDCLINKIHTGFEGRLENKVERLTQNLFDNLKIKNQTKSCLSFNTVNELEEILKKVINKLEFRISKIINKLEFKKSKHPEFILLQHSPNLDQEIRVEIILSQDNKTNKMIHAPPGPAAIKKISCSTQLSMKF